MLFLLLIMMCAVVYTANKMFLIEKHSIRNPFDVCRMYNIKPFVCSSRDIADIVETMKRYKVSAVAIGGTNGAEGEFVLKDNGIVEMYNPYTNNARYFVFYGSLSDVERIISCIRPGLNTLAHNMSIPVLQRVYYDHPRIGMTNENMHQCSSRCSSNTNPCNQHHCHHHCHC